MKKNRVKLSLIAAVMASLSCSGISFAATDSYGMMVKSPTLPTVLVQSHRENSYEGGMVNRETRLGVLGNVDFMKAPVNSLSFTRKVLDKSGQPAREFFDVVTNHPSVQVGGCSTDNNVELQIRGINYNSYDILVDGVGGLMPMGSHALNWVERVEVTAGGNSSLNGVSPYRSSTGYINVVPKRATDSGNRNFTETFSGKNIFSHALDIGERFGNQREWGVRINAMLSKGDTSISREHIEHNNLFLSLDRRNESGNTSILLGSEYVKHTGMPEILMLRDNVWGNAVTKLPDPSKVIDNFMPAWSELSRSRKVALIQHEQKIDDDWATYVRLGYQSIDYPGYLDSKPALLNDAGDYKLSISGNSSQSRFLRHSFSTGVRGQIKWGETTHQMTIGYDRISSMNEWSNGADGTSSALVGGNIYKNEPLAAFAKPKVAAPKYYAGNDDAYYSRYLTDYISLADDRLHVLVGARHQTIKTKAYVQSSVIPVFAALYEVSPTMSIYGSYGQTVDTASAPKDAKNSLAILDPVRTRQYEIGVKFDHGKLATMITAFSTRKPIGVYDKDNVFSMDGDVEHKGLEVNVFGKLSDSISIQGGFMLLKTEQNKMTNPALNGKRAYGTAPFNATLGIEWMTPIEGLSLNGRLIHMGASYADAMNLIKVPSWTRFDLGANYEMKRGNHNYRFSAMVYNVFDQHYWSSMVVKWGERGIMLNPGRNISATVSIDF